MSVELAEGLIRLCLLGLPQVGEILGEGAIEGEPNLVSDRSNDRATRPRVRSVRASMDRAARSLD